MSDKSRLEAELQGVRASLEMLETEYEKGMLDVARYLRLKTQLETRKTKLEQELENLTHTLGTLLCFA
jgi:outer membrane protein TolC